MTINHSCTRTIHNYTHTKNISEGDGRIKQGVIRDNSCKIKLKMRYIPEIIGPIITGGWQEKDN